MFDRYLAGELSRAEETELLRGLAGRGEDRWAVDALRACRDRATAATFRTIGELSVTDDPAADLEGVVRLERALRLSEAAIDPPATRPRALSFRHPGGTGRARDTWPRWVGAASAWRVAAMTASVVVALGIGLAIGVGRHSAGLRATVGREYATAVGQRLSVVLVDGTQITLAPASRVRLAAGYEQGAREVALEGQAYFVVAHDAARPFAVRVRGAVARDVGTAFDVRAYPEGIGARIAVADGVVAVVGATCSGPPSVAARRPTTCGAQLRAGDMATVHDGEVAVEHGIDVPSLTAWTEGRLVFTDAPLRQVVAELSRWYGVDVQVSDASLADQRVSGTVDEASIVPALASLAPTVGARVERAGDIYVLVPRPDVGSAHGTGGGEQ